MLLAFRLRMEHHLLVSPLAQQEQQLQRRPHFMMPPSLKNWCHDVEACGTEVLCAIVDSTLTTKAVVLDMVLVTHWCLTDRPGICGLGLRFSTHMQNSSVWDWCLCSAASAHYGDALFFCFVCLSVLPQ